MQRNRSYRLCSPTAHRQCVYNLKRRFNSHRRLPCFFLLPPPFTIHASVPAELTTTALLCCTGGCLLALVCLFRLRLFPEPRPLAALFALHPLPRLPSTFLANCLPPLPLPLPLPLPRARPNWSTAGPLLAGGRISPCVCGVGYWCCACCLPGDG